MRNTRHFSHGILLPLALALAAGACSSESAAAGTAHATGAPAAVATATLQAPAASNPMAAQMGKMGGAMQATAEHCGDDYSTSELKAMKDRQLQMAMQRGATEAEFEAGFKSGLAEGKRAIESSSPEQRARSCEQLRMMQQSLPQG